MTGKAELSNGVLISSVHAHHLVSACWVHPDEIQLARQPAEGTKTKTELVVAPKCVFRTGDTSLEHRWIPGYRAMTEMAAITSALA